MQIFSEKQIKISKDFVERFFMIVINFYVILTNMFSDSLAVFTPINTDDEWSVVLNGEKYLIINKILKWHIITTLQYFFFFQDGCFFFSLDRTQKGGNDDLVEERFSLWNITVDVIVPNLPPQAHDTARQTLPPENVMQRGHSISSGSLRGFVKVRVTLIGTSLYTCTYVNVHVFSDGKSGDIIFNKSILTCAHWYAHRKASLLCHIVTFTILLSIIYYVTYQHLLCYLSTITMWHSNICYVI